MGHKRGKSFLRVWRAGRSVEELLQWSCRGGGGNNLVKGVSDLGLKFDSLFVLFFFLFTIVFLGLNSHIFLFILLDLFVLLLYYLNRL